MRRQRPAEAPKAVHMNTSLSISTRMERRAPAQVSSRCMIDTRRSNLTRASRCWLDHREIQCNRWYTLNPVCYSHCACLTGRISGAVTTGRPAGSKRSLNTIFLRFLSLSLSRSTSLSFSPSILARSINERFTDTDRDISPV